jgi:hypothetical protein
MDTQVAPPPAPTTFTLVLSREVVANATVSINPRTDPSMVTRFELYESVELISATAVWSPAPGVGHANVYWTGSTTAASTAVFMTALCATRFYGSDESFPGGTVPLLPAANFGTELKAANLGNPSPRVVVHSDSVAGLLRATFVVRVRGSAAC